MLEDRINKIPGREDGWWHGGKGGNGDRFLKLAMKLIDKGFTEDEAVELLHDAYWVVADEFGQ